MRKDLIAIGIAVPIVAIVVLSLNKGKAVSVAPTATQAGSQASSQSMKSMEAICKRLVGKDKSKVTAAIGAPYTSAAGVSYYQAAKAGFKPPYAVALTFDKKKKVKSAKVVSY
jgi:hypothetical protein